jgi:Zn-dependent protease
MRLAWKMGRVAGIDIYIHATFLLVFLFTRALGPGGIHPLAAVFTLCAVFGCVLLHELGHALMARRFGIGTVDITLYPVGGVARLKRMPRAPGAELLIALAGPAVNFAIAAVLGVLLFAGSAVFGFGLSFASLPVELLVINLGLGLFNLIPAFPMDGGRVLRALLSIPFGRARATQVASTVGQALAVLFAVAAVVWTGNLIHIALAAVIFFAARNEEAQVLYEERHRSFAAQPAQSAQPSGQGMWVAPPGYRWVHRGNGLWQLAPIGVHFPDAAAREHSAWR